MTGSSMLGPCEGPVAGARAGLPDPAQQRIGADILAALCRRVTSRSELLGSGAELRGMGGVAAGGYHKSFASEQSVKPTAPRESGEPCLGVASRAQQLVGADCRVAMGGSKPASCPCCGDGGSAYQLVPKERVVLDKRVYAGYLR